jgi:hypothetical protein
MTLYLEKDLKVFMETDTGRVAACELLWKWKEIFLNRTYLKWKVVTGCGKSVAHNTQKINEAEKIMKCKPFAYSHTTCFF